MILRRVEKGDYPRHLISKIYRLADRIAARSSVDPVIRVDSSTNWEGAIQQFEVVTAWCEVFVARRTSDQSEAEG